MAEFGEDGSLPPSTLGDKAHCEVSFANGDCGLSDNMVGSGSLVAPGGQAGVESANASVGPVDARSDIPRRSSIIKMGTIK
ncbi:putative inactive phospholipase C-like protein 2 [Scophthalmus maximus]|uniref:Putative inactive phospholipase C-like protein 2 n=1 Tax=Scophthalmus maximus TaxID=52904 RepID=A0A2U9CGL8_SCOMX|nr:putative inactive phospholipase C-like protein 2 [Scophthalmus maximus]